MIFVARIVGESLDLQNGQELPPAVVLSNGEQELNLYVGEQDMRRLVAMYVGTPKGEERSETMDEPSYSETELSVAKRMAPAPQIAAPQAKPKKNRYVDPESGTESV